jgi:tripartite-type tricarboxylate transporter receptor subunit TctC
MNAPQDDTNFGIGTLVTRVCAAAALALVALSQSAHAQYPEKNIDLIVPYGPGGGFDLYARAVGRAMENHLPKTIRVIVRNVPGAGSVNGIASMYRAAPDGYTMGIVDLPGAVAPQIMGEQLPYDLDKATWLGTVNIGVYSLVIGKKPTFSTLEAFQKPTGRAPFFATTGSNDLAMARIAAAVLGIKAQFLTSYTGGPATHLAIIRGEADAGLGIDVAIARHLASGDLRQLVWFAKKGTRGTPPGVSTADDVGHPELANLSLNRVFAAPPGLPEMARTRLADVIQKALKDPELEAWATKTNFPLDVGTPEQTQKLYTDQRVFLTSYRHLLKTD